MTVYLDAEVLEILTDPTPCDGCHNRIHCTATHQACIDFSRYINEDVVLNENREPSAERYDRLYPGE
jgi:hypothetical protein